MNGLTPREFSQTNPLVQDSQDSDGIRLPFPETADHSLRVLNVRNVFCVPLYQCHLTGLRLFTKKAGERTRV